MKAWIKSLRARHILPAVTVVNVMVSGSWSATVAFALALSYLAVGRLLNQRRIKASEAQEQRIKAVENEIKSIGSALTFKTMGR